MHNKLTTTFLAFAALALPTIAMADVSNNVTLNSGQHYSFDTGTTSTSGGDIDFTGTSITAQGSATFYTLGDLGASGYNALAQSEITSFPLTLFSTTPVSGSTFIATDLFSRVHERRTLCQSLGQLGERFVLVDAVHCLRSDR